MGSRCVTVAKGIRYREHPTRKHGIRLDRYFFVRYQVAGKQVEEGLGWASEGWTLERAQESLIELKKANRTGEGEATLREKRAKAEDERKVDAGRLEKSVADLWDRYSKEVAAVENKPRTVAEKTRMWDKRIKPAIGPLKINEVTEEDVGAVVRSPLKLDDKGKVTGGRAEGGNIYRLLHHMFSKALGWGLRSKALGNPLENVTEPKVGRRERLLTAGEVGALMKALDKAKADGTERPQVVDAIKAAILTGARINELLGLRWQDIRRHEMEIHLPDTKTGFSRRPLSADALDLFDGVTKMPGVAFVFRGIDTPKKRLSYNTVEPAFGRIAKVADVPNCTLHTIRHWFATMTANSVSNPRVGMALTGHKSHAAYMNYIHGDKAQAKALADQLATLATGLGKAAENVTALPKKEGGH